MDTLLPVIQRYVLPGTTVVSDLWGGYSRLEGLSEEYQHLTVNHSVNSVNPESVTHTTTVEGFWQKLKHSNKRRYGTQRSLFEEYIWEFMWKREFREDAFYLLWAQIMPVLSL